MVLRIRLYKGDPLIQGGVFVEDGVGARIGLISVSPSYPDREDYGTHFENKAEC